MNLVSRPFWRVPALWIYLAAAYVPALTAAPGRMPSDTKLYLYLDPGRLLADASLTWDTRQFAGWVPHQIIAYLWPSGPWFWVFETLGIPDWIAHRLWLGTLLLMGGLGVRWAARQLGLDTWGAGVAGLLYLLTPYVLPYVSRTSVMLLPWAGLGWLLGLTVRVAHQRRWRDVGLFGLVVLTVGAVNATALALVAPAPVLWLIHAALARIITWRRALATACRLGAVSIAVSTWWIVMLLVQGRYGADLLRFSETLRDVSHTSVSSEVWRSLGYWLFYVADPYAHTTTASIPYMTSAPLIVISYAVPVVGLLSLGLVRWQHRRFAAWSVIAGMVLAIGVHPYEDPSPLMRPVVDSVVALALRSSTRALPLVVLGIALAAGAAVSALGPTSIRWRTITAATLVAAALASLPAAWTGGYVDVALERDQDVPVAWRQATAALDAGSSEFRVLQLPGSEFGAFRWGYTVDPPLPGLTARPLVTRDLLPLGSPGAMDLLYALDNRFQSGTVDPASIAPVARLLGADTIWVSNDQAFDRFRTPRPELVADLFRRRPAGLGEPQGFGDPVVNVPAVEMVDEQSLSDPRVGRPLAPVELVEVLDAVPVVRTATRPLLVSGSGDGLVDAAAAGLITGDEAVFYGADLVERPELEPQLIGTTPVIVTDSNRKRAVHWRSSQDVSGMTESASPMGDLLRDDVADQRLEVFATADPVTQTVAALHPTDPAASSFTIRASSYGEPFSYRPEHRATMAVDGDSTTAWLVGIRGNPIGEAIEIGPAPSRLMLLQSQERTANRRIAEIRVDQGGRSKEIVLDDRSLAPPGQPVALDPSGADARLTILAVEEVLGGTDSGPSGVGFAEIGPTADEVLLLPQELLDDVDDRTPLALVMRRDRTRATDRWRSDPEPALRRRFELPVARDVDLTVTLRLDARAPDRAIDALAGISSPSRASHYLTGVVAARGASATDGDMATAWRTPIGAAVGSSLSLDVAPGVLLDGFDLVQPTGDDHSPITSLRVTSGGTTVDVAVPPADSKGRSAIDLPTTLTSDGVVELEIAAIDPRIIRDRRYGEQTTRPASIAEVDVDGLARPTPTAEYGLCREDLLTVDGSPVALRVTTADLAALLAGDPVSARPCSQQPLRLTAGPHDIVGTGGRDAAQSSGIDVDMVVIESGDVRGDEPMPAAAVEVSRSRTSRTLQVQPCPSGCWLIVGEGFDPAWEASTSGHALGDPVRVAGGFNGWFLEPKETTRSIELTWPPQRRLDLALAASALVALACLAMIAVDRVRRPFDVSPAPRFALLDRPASQASALGAAGALVLGTLLLIGPEWFLVAAVVAVAIAVSKRPRWTCVAAAVLLAGLGARVAFRQLRNDLPADARWVEGLERWHSLGVFLIVLVVAASLTSDPPTDVGPSAAERSPGPSRHDGAVRVDEPAPR